MNSLNSSSHSLEKRGLLPKISVITVTYNSVKTLEKTIESVISQHYPNLEYIIVDGGSTDSTISVIKNYQSKITKWLSEKDKGTFDAMNKGIKLASGELIGIINSDDFYLEGAFERVASEAAKHLDIDVFYGDVVYKIPNRPAFTIKSKYPLKRSDFYSTPVIHPTVFIRRSCYLKHGDFDLTYPLAADYDLLLRFLDAKVKFYYLNKTLACMRAGGASDTHYLEGLEEVRMVLSKRGASPYLSFRFALHFYRAMIAQFACKQTATRLLLHGYHLLRDSLRAKPPVN